MVNLMSHHERDEQGVCVFGANEGFPHGGCCPDCDEAMVLKKVKERKIPTEVIERIIHSQGYQRAREEQIFDSADTDSGEMHELVQEVAINKFGEELDDDGQFNYGVCDDIAKQVVDKLSTGRTWSDHWGIKTDSCYWINSSDGNVRRVLIREIELLMSIYITGILVAKDRERQMRRMMSGRRHRAA